MNEKRAKLGPHKEICVSSFVIELQINKYCNVLFHIKNLISIEQKTNILPLIKAIHYYVPSFYNECCKTFKLVHIYSHCPPPPLYKDTTRQILKTSKF